jgi:hypothetical protein
MRHVHLSLTLLRHAQAHVRSSLRELREALRCGGGGMWVVGRVAKTQRSFVQKYFTAFKTVADVPLNLSTDLGQPLCTMRSSDNSMGALKPDKKQLNDLKQEINHVVASLLGATYSQQMLDSE